MSVTITVNAIDAVGAKATTTATATQQAASSWPSGWDDPRFANNVASGRKVNTGNTIVTWQNLTVEDESGTEAFGYQNYKLLNSRYRGREGPRVSGSNITIDGCYIEVHGVGADHADGIQAYGGSGAQQNFKSIIIRNTKVVCTTGALNCGIFFADHCGADLTLENVYVDGGSAPNGAIWLPCTSTDKGVNSLIARNVMVTNSTGRQGLELSPNPSLCKIIEWTNVRWANGTPIPRP